MTRLATKLSPDFSTVGDLGMIRVGWLGWSTFWGWSLTKGWMVLSENGASFYYRFTSLVWKVESCRPYP